MIETHPTLPELIERPGDVQHVAPSAVRRLLAELSAHRRLLDEIETALRAIDPEMKPAKVDTAIKKKPTTKRRPDGLTCPWAMRRPGGITPW